MSGRRGVVVGGGAECLGLAPGSQHAEAVAKAVTVVGEGDLQVPDLVAGHEIHALGLEQAHPSSSPRFVEHLQEPR